MRSETVVNVDECRRVADYLELHPERHDQGDFFDGPFWDDDGGPVDLLEDGWECETTACVAGWTCLLNGWAPVSNLNAQVRKGGVTRFASTVAAELLGLDDAQDSELFFRIGDRAEALAYLRELVGGDGARP